MAKIEMDISEYEAIQENKKLLQQSLDRERELQEQVTKLNEEKIKALEDAKMKVVKTIKSETTEHILVRRDFRDKFYQIKNRIFDLFARPDYNGFKGSDQFLQYEIENLIDIYFEKNKSYSLGQPEITTHGLDEVKAELREEIKKELSATYNKDMELVRDAQQILSQKQKHISNLESAVSSLERANIDMSVELSAKIQEIEELKEDLKNQDSFINKIIKLSEAESNFFNSQYILNKIKKEIRSWAE